MIGRRAAFIAALSACMFWGVYGYFSRNLAEAGLDSLQIAGFRLLVTCAILAVFIFFVNKDLFRIRRRSDLLIFLAFAVVIIMENYLYTEALLHIPLAIGEILQMTSPFFVMLIVMVIFGEMPTPVKVIATITAIFGGCLVTDVFSADNLGDVFGYLLALGSGLTLAICAVGIKTYSNKGYNPLTLMFWVFFFAAVITVPVSGIFGSMDTVFSDYSNILLILGFGLIPTAIPYSLQAWSISRIDVTTVSIISISQCIFAGIAGYILFDESLSVMNLIGMVILMGSLAVMEYLPMLSKRNSSPPQRPHGTVNRPDSS